LEINPTTKNAAKNIEMIFLIFSLSLIYIVKILSNNKARYKYHLGFFYKKNL